MDAIAIKPDADDGTNLNPSMNSAGSNTKVGSISSVGNTAKNLLASGVKSAVLSKTPLGNAAGATNASNITDRRATNALNSLSNLSSDSSGGQNEESKQAQVADAAINAAKFAASYATGNVIGMVQSGISILKNKYVQNRIRIMIMIQLLLYASPIILFVILIVGPHKEIIDLSTQQYSFSSPQANASGPNGTIDINVSPSEAAGVSLDSRMSWLFPDGVPTTSEQMAAYLTTIPISYVNADGTVIGANITVHAKLAVELQVIFSELQAAGVPINSISCYNWRNMVGRSTQSHHSYGVACDINPNQNWGVYGNGDDPNNPYYISSNSVMVQIFKAHGFYWGGDWSAKYYDPMHFTYTNH